MKAIPLPRLLSSLLCSILISCASSVYAAESGSQAMPQGQAALLIANRLGLFAGSSTLATETMAVQRLAAQGVTPDGGWDTDASMTPGSLARLLVQALGVESELTDSEIAGNDDEPFLDLLIEMYGLDLSNVTMDAAGINAAMDALVGPPSAPNPITGAPGDPDRTPSNPPGSAGSGGGGGSGSPSGAAPP